MFICKFCGHVYYSQGRLRRHEITLHGASNEDSLSCPECAAYFTSHFGLRSHLQKQHGIQPDDLAVIKRRRRRKGNFVKRKASRRPPSFAGPWIPVIENKSGHEYAESASCELQSKIEADGGSGEDDDDDVIKLEYVVEEKHELTAKEPEQEKEDNGECVQEDEEPQKMVDREFKPWKQNEEDEADEESVQT